MTLVRPVAGSARSEKKSPDRLARLLALGRPIVMGVLNVTPDSFSDGGRFLDPVDAIDQARRMTAEGADVLDIGAESTRPYGGAVAVPIAEEMRRLGPVLPAVVGLGVAVSLDTMKAQVAASTPAGPTAGRIDRRPSARGRRRSGDHPHPRRRRDRAGAARRRGHRERPMTDAVFVTGLALHAYHGVMQHEAKVGQTFNLDLVLDIDLAAASRSDKLAHTVGYDQVVEVASQAFCARRYRLVEAAAGAVAQAILDRFPQVLRVRVTVHKPHAPIAATFAGVGVTIVRDRQGRG